MASGDAFVGDLRAVELLGEGGSAEVWRAEDSAGGSLAVKVLRPGLPGAAALLLREHAVLDALRHPHVVCTYGLVELDGTRALVMEYLGGGDLVSLAGSHPRHWILAVRDLLTAVRHVHAQGYAHRDIKARNVRFDEHDRVRLIDFASVAPFGAAEAAGGTTAAYRSRAGARIVGPEDDVFAFAVLLYELFAGRLPFGADPLAARGAPPEPPAITDAVPGMQPLIELVLRTLRTPDTRDAGSLSAFGDVIESVVMGGL